LAECIAQYVPNPRVPFSDHDMSEIHDTFRAVQ
jgi:hypothetical protein